MRALHMLVAVVLSLFSAAALSAGDEISSAMKQILDQRKNDFASIRKDPHDASGEVDYMSTVVVPGAKRCYIRQDVKPHYSDRCDVAESKNRAAVMAKYATYVKDLKSATATTWTTWTEKKSRPAGEETYMGPDHSHPAASVGWVVEGMNADYYLLSVAFFADGYARP